MDELPEIGECPNCGAEIGLDWDGGHDCPECGQEMGVPEL